MTEFQKALLEWYDREKRDLPWRGLKDPYAIWVSESMLQQTRVATVESYYRRWMTRFPNVLSLSMASEEDVLSHWQGLGYYRRARNLQAAAKAIVSSEQPTRFEDWLKLPGIGRYTAAAIASIAQNEAVPLVDGNVERVYARISADSSSGASLKKSAWDWAESNLATERPGDWNQALMELGAMICTQKSPACASCPVSMFCKAKKGGVQGDLPVRPRTASPTRLDWDVIVPVRGDEFGLIRFPKGGWWEGMMGFEICEKGTQEISKPYEFAGEFSHRVTRYDIRARVLMTRARKDRDGIFWVSAANLASSPIPSFSRKALKLAQIHVTNRALEVVNNR